MNITAKELRTRVAEVIECLDRGEPVILTYRGKPRATLTGIGAEAGSEGSAAGSESAFGMWRDRDELDDVDAHVRNLRAGRSRADRY